MGIPEPPFSGFGSGMKRHFKIAYWKAYRHHWSPAPPGRVDAGLMLLAKASTTPRLTIAALEHHELSIAEKHHYVRGHVKPSD